MATESRFDGKRALLPGLLIFVTVIHVIAFAADRPIRLWGDEGTYALNAKTDAAQGETSLVPGRLPFRTQPEFASRVYSKFAHRPRLQRSVSLLDICLLPLVLLLTYAQARRLGVPERGALIGAGLLGVFPWFGFHVHSLWPEVLHALFFGAALLGLLAALRADRVRYVVPAGVATAFALLTKGVLQAFLPVFAIVLGVAFFRRARNTSGTSDEIRSGLRSPAARALLAPGAYLLTILAVLLPQLIANDNAGHGYHLAANRWWNLELGLTADPKQGRTIGSINEAYMATSTDDIRREELARERTLAFVRERGVIGVLAAQIGKCARLVFERESSFERSIGDMERWGAEPPTVLAMLRLPSRVLWFAILALGLAGLGLHVRAGPGWALLSAFVLVFFAAIATVPLKVRFLMPVVPVLCIFAGAAIERGARAQRR